jgi:lantibiotic leader peptide-processing serine protease
MHAFGRMAAAGVVASVVAACAETPAKVSDPTTDGPSLSIADLSGGRSVIIGADGVLPSDLAAQVTAAGGTLTGVLPEIGVAFATNLGTKTLTGVESVAADLTMQYAPTRTVEMGTVEENAPSAQVASLADNEPFYRYQWAPAAVQAPESWNAGVTGRGVRVAVLDGGLYNAHPDLAAGIDAAASRSFATGAYNTDVGSFWHGTHVAGIIGARDNGLGVIGIAPNVTLIGVKVLHNGSGSFEAVINGIVYAAKPRAQGGAGAQVINMSLGGYIENAKDHAIKAEVRELSKAIDRATRYANAQGTTVIAAAGNDASNLDVNKFDLNLPGMSARVIGVTATAPLGWAYGNTNFARQASYTNFGKAAVTFAAPGGDFAWPTNENCTLTGNTRPCWVFDMYLSTSRAGYTWAAGTSMASPVVAGIAALIIEANGGTLEPAQVKAKLAQGALDLGKPGFDAVYGHGFVNALNSVNK